MITTTRGGESSGQFKALKEDIADRGILTPIDIDEKGNILDGHHRFRACKELGIIDFPTVIRLGLTEQEKRLFSRKSNMMRRHLNRKQIRELIAAQLKETPKWANNRIGLELGVSHNTVKKVRTELEATCQIDKFDKLEGLDKKVRKGRKPAILAADEDEKLEILRKIEQEADLDGLSEGFMNIKSFFGNLPSPTQMALNGLTEDQVLEWNAFGFFLEKEGNWIDGGVSYHLEWIVRKEFETPEEWLGEEGDRFRKSYGGGVCKEFKAEALKYIEEKNKTLKKEDFRFL